MMVARLQLSSGVRQRSPHRRLAALSLSTMLPPEIRTPRLLLRRQRPEDAALIKDAVDTSLSHLKASVGWARTAPFPISTLVGRLADSAAAFDAGSEWAFTILDRSG